MTQPKERLTNEWISKHFPDKFMLAMRAIAVAKHHMHSGQDFTLNSLLEKVDTTMLGSEEETKE